MGSHLDEQVANAVPTQSFFEKDRPADWRAKIGSMLGSEESPESDEDRRIEEAMHLAQ